MERAYESMIIMRSDLTDEERETVFDKITRFIKDSGGKIQESKVWAKERNFYFLIRSRGAEKKKYDKGLYWLINFSLDPEQLNGLKQTMRLEERILRNIIINRGGKKGEKHAQLQ